LGGKGSFRPLEDIWKGEGGKEHEEKKNAWDQNKGSSTGAVERGRKGPYRGKFNRRSSQRPKERNNWGGFQKGFQHDSGKMGAGRRKGPARGVHKDDLGKRQTALGEA